MTTYDAILYVDPGLRTGWATWDRDGKRFNCGISDPEDTFDLVERWCNLHAGQRALLGFETFTITAATARKSRDAIGWPLELIGMGRYLAWRNEITFECAQSPSAAKRFAPDHKLRENGFYRPGKEDHARDAARHLLLKLSKLRLV